MLQRGMREVGLVVALGLLLSACGGPTPGVPSTPASQEALVSTLERLQTALEAKDYPAAAACMAPFPGMTKEQMTTGVTRFKDLKEISRPGIGILAAQGRYGPLLEIFPERGEAWATKAGVDAAACFALAHGGAEVAAHWNGQAFLLIRLDDVGKLE